MNAVSPRVDAALWSSLVALDRAATLTLQAQIRAAIAGAILDGRLDAGMPMPPTRKLASLLGVARVTVLLAYRGLVEEGFLTAQARSGHAVDSNVLRDSSRACRAVTARPAQRLKWTVRLAAPATRLAHVPKVREWQQYPYPFVFGQFDASLFPTAAWREANQLAIRKLAVREWAGDRVDRDDPQLVTQIQTRLLTRRGIWVRPEEILVTLGAQNAMFLVATMLRGRARCIGLENPCYPDLRNVFSLLGLRTRSLAMDDCGLRAGKGLGGCDYICVAPGHQNPTTITMPIERRRELLEAAVASDAVIIEDDYDSELSYRGEATPSIRALDGAGRVVYVGSLSKTLAPGLRLGYLVAPPEFIEEARAVRRLVLRHPPANNQRALALFLSLGHHDALIRRLVRSYSGRAQALADALARRLPEVSFRVPTGGSALWARAPSNVDMRRVRELAATRGVLFDAGDVFYASSSAPSNRFRLGYSSIGADRIDAGIAVLARCLREVARGG